MSKPEDSRRANSLKNPAENLSLATLCGEDVSRRAACRALLALAAAGVLLGNPACALAADATEETKKALATAQEKYDEVKSQMEQLSAQFTNLSEQQNKTLDKIEALQEQIDEAQAQIDAKQEELEEKQSQLSERISGSYKSGGQDMLALLLSSKSFDELISNAYYVGKINERDQKAIEEVHQIQKELESQKADLEEQMSELQTLKDKQSEQLEEMKAKKDEVQDLLDGLSDDVKELIEKRDEEIVASAKAEEAARKAAAAAAAAAKKKGSSGVSGGSGQASAGANAQQRVVNACYSTPSPGGNLCAAWVSYVFNNAGLGWVGGNADDMYNSWCTSSNKNNLKVGMIIAVSSHSHTVAGSIYGHVGIYVGGQTVMDNVGYIRSIDVDEWISYYGTTVTPRWGWALGINLAG